MRKTVLILGASGRFGRHATEAFWNAGWAIHTFDRQADDLMQAAKGMDVIVMAANPAYPDWSTQLLPVHAKVQAAARASGASVILPSNVYVYGADTPLPWGPQSAHAAQNPLGQVRIKMEQSYRDSGVQTIFLRAGDFMDTETSDSWLDKVILKNLHKGYLVYPGALNAPHSWAWLPDLAAAAVKLAERRLDLQQIEEVCFAGYTLTAMELAKALTAATGLPLRVKQMGWWPLRLAAPVWPLARHLQEMRYLWTVPHRLDGTKLHQLCPDFRDTDLIEAMSVMAGHTLRNNRKERQDWPRGGRHLRLT